jgi:hypothetical protein
LAFRRHGTSRSDMICYEATIYFTKDDNCASNKILYGVIYINEKSHLQVNSILIRSSRIAVEEKISQ